MKIIFLTPVSRKISGKTLLEEPIGGTHSVLINLAENLVKQNYEVTIFCNCTGEEGFYNGVEYLQSNKIIRYCKENEVDIFVCVAAELTLKVPLKVKKTVLWLHNDYSPYWHNELSDQAEIVANYMYNKADKVIVVSNWQKEIIQKIFNIPENHIKVIYNGINTTYFNTKIEKTNKNKIIYTSAPDRGLDLLINFFPELKKLYPDLELHIYSSFKTWGKYDYHSKELEASIFEKAKETEGIFIKDPIPMNKLSNELLTSYIMLYPNHSAPQNYFNAETFCLSVVEGEASGLPIITSDRGALSEVVENNISGYLIDEEPYSENYKKIFIEKFVQLYDNSELYNKFSENAIKKANDFSWEKIIKEWDNFFQQLIKEDNSLKKNYLPLKAKFEKPEISIIIPTYNRASNLFHCLTALTRQNYNTFEVIIVDDGSTDNTREIVEGFRNNLNLRYVYAGKNEGFRAARARNIGLSKVRGNIVIFLDSDIIVPSTYIEEHLKAHEKFDRVLVNSFVYRMKSENQQDLGLEPEKFILKHKDNLNDDIKHEFGIFDKNPIEEGYFLDSNSVSIKTEHIMEEGFDETFVGWGHEDTELGYRFIHKGFRFLFLKNNCESYHIYHYVSPEKDNETAENWKRLAKKYHLKKWYDPRASIEVECPIRIINLDLEKAKKFTNIVEARIKIKLGDRLDFFPIKTISI